MVCCANSGIIKAVTENATNLSELKSILDLVRWSASRFCEAKLNFGHGTGNAFDEALMLVSHALHLPAQFPEQYLQARVTAVERTVVLELIQQRIDTRKPAAYLTHEAWFAGLPFFVDERVLVPRSPIAEYILQGFEPWLQADEIESVLDLCCGSACIGIACAVHFDNAQVDAADISAEALKVAAENVQRHELQDWVQLIESDLFEQIPAQRYQLIVSNPPYVSADEMAGLPAEYNHEPALGLQANQEGLEIVVRILAQASAYLSDDGIIVVEVGNSQELLEECFPEVPFIWLEFQSGGHGVFLLEAEQLKINQHFFEQALKINETHAIPGIEI